MTPIRRAVIATRSLRTILAFAMVATVRILACGNEPAERLPSGDTSSLFWTQEERIVGFRNFDTIYRTRPIDNGTDFLALVSDPIDFSDLTYDATGDTHTLDHYLETFFVAGLLVVRGEKILLERYRLGHDETSRWVSYSIAKSVTSLLVGAALKDGYIDSLDEAVTDYLPRLKGSAYDRATIRDVLHMASGVTWNESYTDPDSDVARAAGTNGIALFDYLRDLNASAEPGAVFNYNTGETNMAGAVLRAAIGNNLSTYLEHKIWGPFGMEADANWLLHEPGGGELGGCCINATLRDYARIGIFAMNGGVLRDGTRVLPEGWMAESTTPSDGYDGYGYLWWLAGDGIFAGIGIFGQYLWMNPSANIVIVTHSAWPHATNPEYSRHRAALVAALAEAVR